MLRRIHILKQFTPITPRPIAPLPHRHFLFRMSSFSSSSQQPPASATNDNDANEEDASSKPLLTLPAPGDVPSDGTAPQLEVNGQDIKLDILGPVVVNEDGTISRIDNWHEMADIEKANVRRILLKRNAARLARLRAEQDQTLAAEQVVGTTTPNDK